MSQKPKIAFYFRYGPADNVELTHATPWILERLARDYEVHYFSPRSTGPLPECMEKWTVLHTLPYSVNRSSTADKVFKTLLWYLALPFLGLRCRRLGVKLVYIDDFLPLGGWITRLASGAHVVIFVVDFLLDAYAQQHPWLRPFVTLASWLDARSWCKASLVFTRTHYGRNILREHGVPEDRIRTVYDACDQDLYRPVDKPAARKTHGYGTGEIVLSHHGVLHPNKGMDRILRALPQVMGKHPDFRFLCIGAGPDLDRLQALARELGIEQNVKFTGWLPSGADVNVALNASDIGLVMRVGDPADHFHITGALVHSMAVGLPVLAPRLRGIEEVLQGHDCGMLFDPVHMEEFQEACSTMVSNAETRNAMGQRSLAAAKELFDVERAAHTVAGALHELVASSGCSGSVKED